MISEAPTRTKQLRVPWIQCRADELGAQIYDFEWKRIRCAVMGYSESEARSWWNGLSPDEKDALLGLEETPAADQMSFF